MCIDRETLKAPIAVLLNFLALAPALLFPAQPALAWGAEGHRMVANIAAAHLAPEAAGKVLALLANDRLADGEPSARTTLGEIAYWADEIKDHEWSRPTRSWHYDDIPVCAPADHADPADYCKRGNCASAQIVRHIGILRNPRTTRRQKNEALKWVVHLAGDLHQPLHAATRHDRGGNLVQVSFFGARENPPYGTITLHTIWDVHMVQRLVAQRGGERAIVSVPVGDAQRRSLQDAAISDWVGESNQLAGRIAYSVIPQRYSCGGKIHEVVTVDQAYYAMAAPIIESQIRKAGIRLAGVLNEALAGGVP